MDQSQANEIRPIFGIGFCLQSPNGWGGGGGYGKVVILKGYKVWLMMKNQTPGSFSHVSVVYKRGYCYWRRESGLFSSRDI